MPPPPRVELHLPEDGLFVLPRAGFAPSSPMRTSRLPSPPTCSASPLAAPSWTASYSSATPRRPLTAADIPSSPASSSASQKFEVKRLLSRPADPMPSPRPLTTFDVSTSFAGPSLSETTVKRSNSASRFLRRRTSKGHLDSSAPSPSQPLPRQRPHDSPSRPTPPAPYTPPPASAATCSTLTPASAYALNYARRTNMTTTPSPSRPRHPFETVGTGRIVALGDPSDDSLTLSLTGSNAPAAPAEKDKGKGKETTVLGLTRKVSARFSRRKRAGTSAGVQSDAEAEDWSREKERAGMRAVGMCPVAIPRSVVSDQSAAGRSVLNRVSRHLSIEDLRDMVHEGGAKFGLEGRGESAKGRVSVEKERGPRTRLDSTSRRDGSKTRRDASARSVSTPGQGYAESRSTGTISPENKTGGGKLWRLVKKMSTGTLKEKRSSHPEKAPPVPPLPPTLSSSRRSSVADYGEQVRPELAQFRSGSNSTQSSRPNTIHQSSTDLTHRSPIASRSTLIDYPTPGRTEYITTSRIEHTTSRAEYTTSGRPSLAEYRPSMTHTTESSVLSCSPKSSFGRTQSPRTSMSSYVDVADDMPPPLPMVGKQSGSVTVGKQSGSVAVGKQPVSVVAVGKQSVSGLTVGKQPAGPLVGKHIVAPGELAQYQHLFPPARDPNTSPSIPSPSLPPPKRPRKPRDKAPLPTSPASTATAESGTVKTKPKPNVLRRPTRLDDDRLSLRTRSPRSASMGMPSPRSASVNPHSPRVRSRTQSEAQSPSPRPRSNSMGTVFTFRELGEKKPLSEQEKVDKFERLLEASDKAGGTLHARLQEQLLLSDTMRLSGSYDESSVSGL
ncbi:hypothetical protein FRC10_005699 [Ceratobasidium sp. 414]|nr:hypothetical protein FRC10_005699 [Ceratobasidium sp. 414]